MRLNPRMGIGHPVSLSASGCPLAPLLPPPPNITGGCQSRLGRNVRRKGGEKQGKASAYEGFKPPVRKISVQITVRDTVEIRCDRRGSGSKRCLSPWATLRSRRWQDAPSRPACPIAWILLRSVGGRRALRAAAMRGSTRAAVELPRGCAEHRRGHGVCG